MCQSVAEGGRRCAAHTRPGFETALASVTSAHGLSAVVTAQVEAMDAAAAHAATPAGAREVADRIVALTAQGDEVTADFLRSAQHVAQTMEDARQTVSAQVAAYGHDAGAFSAAATAYVDPEVWDPGTPNTDVGEHWSIAEGGTRWHEGGCGAFAIAMTERWPHLKIACELYDDHGAESVAHAWAYDPSTNKRFHIFGAEDWTPTTSPDYDPDSHRVVLDQSPDDVRRLFRGFNTSEDQVYDAMDVAVELFDPNYQPDESDDYDRNHLYF